MHFFNRFHVFHSLATSCAHWAQPRKEFKQALKLEILSASISILKRLPTFWVSLNKDQQNRFRDKINDNTGNINTWFNVKNYIKTYLQEPFEEYSIKFTNQEKINLRNEINTEMYKKLHELNY